MSAYTVYKHTSPSGKVYIGLTCQEPAKRWGPDGNGYKHSPHLRAAIQRYGWDSFGHEILAEGLTKQEAERLEIELIAEHHATDPIYGYNIDRGGSTGPKHSAETRAKIREANSRRVWTDSARQKVSEYRKAHPLSPESCKLIGDKNRGRKHKAESIEKIRAAQKKIAVKNITTGESYASVSEAAAACNLDPSHIVGVCRGRRRSAGGCYWQYEEVIT